MTDREDGYRLYEFATYAPTDRLQALRADQEELTEQDLLDLYRTFKAGTEEQVGPEGMVTLKDFGTWISGTGDFGDCEPAEVIW